MPIYEYQCKKCKKVFEIIQKISDKPLNKCEECFGTLIKLISESSFLLKGGGWYKDLYSTSKKPESKDTSQTDSTKETPKTEKKETKKESQSNK
ncbi:MAG: zinc ribbon domain-containing protein [Deltaproteobacteria bacterium]|nr:zinc ribbon domain-containing protein [Deltaproteobacteria bacterium]